MTRQLIPLLLLLLPAMLGAQEAARTFDVPNALRLSWPWDLLSFDVEPAEVPPGDLSLELQGRVRPVQAEAVTTPEGRRVTRLWSVATLTAEPAPNGKDRPAVPDRLQARLLRARSDSALSVTEEPGAYVIDNGVQQFRLRRYDGRLPQPLPLGKLPHWIAGMRPRGAAAWEGRAWFEGDARVIAATSEIIARGPVFVEARVVLLFEGQEAGDGSVPVLPLASGKQSFRWRPGEPPTAELPKREAYYEARVRWVWGDPWVDVNELFRLPPRKDDAAWGIHQYYVHWGRPSAEAAGAAGFDPRVFAPVDTVTWVRWFEWDAFGGNVDQLWIPAQPRPAQKGRPFALLRPVWNQGGGGAQDFFVTHGGKEPAGDATNAPMFGVVAACAGKWVAPYAQTIAAYALDGDRAQCRFPLTDGTGAKAWYAQRAYGLCAGPRAAFPSLNNLVRRHADWTLAAQVAAYRLDWPGRAASPSANAPTCDLYLQRRYQDDFLNPTQRITRDVKKYAQVKPGTCGPRHAALGYIYADPDHWPGWRNGFAPGNPNFHTDKYMGLIYIASAMPDHPDARAWLALGKRCFGEDLAKVFFQPDGVGYECPGYAGYSTGLQLGIADSLLKQGLGNAVADNPLFAANARWHRHLLTPVDPRLGRRHEAPHGDTHRWDSGLGAGFGLVAWFLRESDPRTAAELLATGQELARTGGIKTQEWQTVLGRGLDGVKPARFEALDWSSRTFEGFGAVLRHGFGTPRETFLSIKAGRARGHYHNDELAFHYFAGGTPASLDYNCSYHPRGDHAALHNTLTFGRAGTLKHNADGRTVEAMEQAGGSGELLAFAPHPAVDVLVAERRDTSVTLSPVRPDDAEFGRQYPSRETGPLRHRRWLALVKHAPSDKLPGYLVVRDEAEGREPAQLNLHLLARALRVEGRTVHAPGQWDQDFALFLVHGETTAVEAREWHYADEWMSGPLEWAAQPGETPEAWAQRIEAARRENGWAQLPPPGWKPTYQDAKLSTNWFARIAATRGAALQPPPGWQAPWTYGEQQQWLRVGLPPGGSLLWVLVAVPRSTPLPACEPIEGGVRLSAGGASEELRLGSGIGVQLTADGRQTVLLEPGRVP